MKFKTVLVFTLLVLASLVTFSNRYKQVCDGRKMIVLTVQKCSDAVQPPTSPEREAAGTSTLLRIAVTL